MTDLLCSVQLNHKSGIAKERFVHSFVVHRDGALPASGSPEMVALQDSIDQFYDFNTGPDGTVASFMSSEFVRTSVPIKYYDITGKLQAAPNAKGNMVPPPHGSPAFEGATILTAAGGAEALPSECAVVMTLRGRGALLRPIEAADSDDPQSLVDRPRQRATGRLYLGPLNVGAMEHDTNGSARVSTYLRNALRISAEAFQESLNSEGWIWAVWSRQEGELFGVTSVEVDDAFDTQRRRGVTPVARNAQVFSPVPDIALGA